MASTGSVNSGLNSSSRIDVAGIVSQLMQVERAPVDKIDGKIASSNVKISSLGQFEAKLSAFNDSLKTLQNLSTVTKASSSNPAMAGVSCVPSASIGRYQLEVVSLATKAVANLTSFSTQVEALDFFKNEIDQNVQQKVDATVYQRAAGDFVLSLRAKNPGSDGSFSIAESQQHPCDFKEATDAVFKLDGITFHRSSNTIADVLSGVTLDLYAPTSPGSVVNVTVSKEVSTDPKAALTGVVTAYNELNTLYKQLTKASVVQTERGALNSDSSLSSVMKQIGAALIKPIKSNAGGMVVGNANLSTLGLEFAEAGQLKFNEDLYNKSKSMAAILESGVRIGFDPVSTKDLSQRIDDMLSANGLVSARIQSEKSIQSQLQSKKATLEEKLTRTQQRLTAQYAALDALLFKLGSTSDSLKTSLDTILKTNSQ